MSKKLDELFVACNSMIEECDCWSALASREKAKSLLSNFSQHNFWEPIKTAPKNSEFLIVKDGPMIVTAYWQTFQERNAWVLLGTEEKIFPTHWLNIKILEEF
jgi:hypothetical protein